MVYIVIAFTGLLVAGALFSGCTIGKEKNDTNAPELNGVVFIQNHMNFGSCYSFYLRKEDDKVLFDAEVRFEEEPHCIILESSCVDGKYLDKLRKLDKECSVAKYVVNYRKSPSLFMADDSIINKVTVFLSDGTEKTADTKDEHIELLYEFFIDLAKTYMSESVYN